VSQSPYRRPDEPRPAKPRGTVARRPDDAAPRDAEKVLSAREHILAAVALEEAARRASRWVRVGGVVAIFVGVALSALTVGDLAAGVVSHPVQVLVVSSVAMLAGAWFAIVGLGGSADPQKLPPWVLTGAVIASIVGTIWGTSFHLAFLAYLAGY
jgi:hypothetical protein